MYFSIYGVLLAWLHVFSKNKSINKLDKWSMSALKY